MSDKTKSSLLYTAAMGALLFGCVVMVGRGMKGGEMLQLIVWAVVYGALLAGSAYHDAKAERR